MKVDPNSIGEGSNLIYVELLDKFEGAKSNTGKPYFKKQYDLIKKYLDCKQQSQEQTILPKLFQTFKLKLDQFYSKSKSEFICLKMFHSNKQQETIKAFQCHDCKQEDNSVICIDCYDKSKHEGHNFEMLDVYGGCCDCGDESKWKQSGFCDKHVFREELNLEINEQSKEIFMEHCHHFMSILCYLYIQVRKQAAAVKSYQQLPQCAQQQKQERKLLNWIIHKTDRFCCQFLATLVEVNTNQYPINLMTKQWLGCRLPSVQDYKVIEEIFHDITVKKLLMLLVELPEAPKLCVKLYMLLFFRGNDFKKQVTILYFNIYATIPLYACSRYSEFSPQIFTNSSIIKKLSDGKKFTPLILSKDIQELIQVEQDVEKFCQNYRVFYNDLNYILDLKQDAFKSYWDKFMRKREKVDNIYQDWTFDKLFPHRKAFSEQKNDDDYDNDQIKRIDKLEVVNKSFYKLEEAALEVFMNIIDKIDLKDDNMKKYLNKNTKKHFRKVLLLQKQLENPFKIEKNLFFTEHRMLAILLFVDIYKQEKLCNLNDIPKKLFKDWLEKYEVSADQLGNCFQKLAFLILDNFSRISQVMRHQEQISKHMSFAKSYFKSANNPNFLFSLDSFLLQLSVNVLVQFQKEFKANYENKITHYINDILQSILEKFNSSIQKYRQQNIIQKKKEEFKKIEAATFNIHIFMNLFQEALRSNITELVLLSKCPSLINKQQHELKFDKFYQKMLRTIVPKSKGVVIDEFKRLTRHLFFKETQYFPRFVEIYRSKDQQLHIIPNCKQKYINLDYFFSIRYKITTQKVSEMIKKTSLLASPFEQIQYGSEIINKLQYFKTLETLINAFKSIPESYQYLVNDCVKQMIKMYQLSHERDDKKNLQQFLNNPKLKFPTLANDPLFYSVDPETQSINRLLKQQTKDSLKQLNIVVCYQNFNFREENEKSESEMNSSLWNSYCHEAKSQQQRMRNNDSQLSSLPEQNPSHEFNYEENRKKNLYVQRVCMLGKECKKPKEKQLFWLCYGKYSNMHPILDFSPEEQIFTISSCGHFCHESCYQIVLKDENHLKCKKCAKNFNFIFSSERLDINLEYQKEILEETEFKVFQKSTPDKKSQRFRDKKVKCEIFRSIIFFILSNLLVDDFIYFRKNIVIYRSLYKKLQFTTNDFKEILFDKNTQKFYLKHSMCQSAKIIQFISDKLMKTEKKLQQTLPQKEKTDKKLSETQIKMEMMMFQYIEKIVDFLNKDVREFQLELPEHSFSFDTSIQEAITTLPQSLHHPQKIYVCQNCDNKADQFAYFRCLLPHPHEKQYRQIYFCHNCIKKVLRPHLKYHKNNQLLFIETDTGKIFYYTLLYQDNVKPQQREILQYQGESVYQDICGTAFMSGKQYNKKKFKLNKLRCKHVMNSLFSWNLVGLAKPL